MPKISIILPFKNASRFIEKTIKSIHPQKIKDWEIIAVNDHSIDSTEKILDWFAESDERIKIFDNPGTGIVPALQKALQEVNGEFITRMDADDIMTAERLEWMHDKLLKSPAKTVITGLVNYISDEEITEGYKKYESWLNEINRQGKQWQNIYRECVVASPNWMMRTDELKQMGGFDNLQYPEDYHLAFKWYQQGFHIECIPEVTLLWREHPDRTSRTSDDYAQRTFFQLKIGEFLKHDFRSENLVLWGTNEKGRLAADVLLERQVDFHWMDLQVGDRLVKGQCIKNYTELAYIKHPQLLVAVYPERKERQVLESHLQKLGLVQGMTWWYL